MSLIEINWHPEDKQLRGFGWIALTATAAIAIILHFWKGLPVGWAAALFAFGIVTFVLSLISLKATRFIFLAMTLITAPIGLAVSFFVLSVFYFLLLTPLGLVFRLVSRDPMQRKFPTDMKTYWRPRKSPETLERYFRQF